jgi:hypothetical protein
MEMSMIVIFWHLHFSLPAKFGNLYSYHLEELKVNQKKKLKHAEEGAVAG